MRRSIVGALSFALLAAAPAAAQTPRFEVGLDATLTSIGQEGEPGTHVWTLPRWLRVGVPLGGHLLLETATAWQRVGVQGSGGGSALEVRPSLAWLWREPGEARPYVALVTGLSRYSGHGESASQALLGGSAGVRLPLRGGAVLRLEVGLDRAFKTDEMPGQNRLRIGIGMSIGIR